MTDNKNELYQSLSQQLKLSPEEIQSSAENGDVTGLTRHMDSDRAQQVERILQDPDKTREILNSPQAQALMKLLNES